MAEHLWITTVSSLKLLAGAMTPETRPSRVAPSCEPLSNHTDPDGQGGLKPGQGKLTEKQSSPV